MEKIFNELTEENKEVLLLVARGMKISQESEVKKNVEISKTVTK
jgi:hypothetical protein